MGNSSETQITNDLRYGKIKKFIYENSLITQKVMDFKDSPDQFANCIHICQLSQSINHKNIIKLHKYEVDQLNVSIFFEHYDYDLYSRISIKLKCNFYRNQNNLSVIRLIKKKTEQCKVLSNIIKNYYQEHELLQMLDQFVSALAYLQQQQIFHNDTVSYIQYLQRIYNNQIYLQVYQTLSITYDNQNIFLTPNETIKLNQQWVIDNTQNQQRYFAPEQIQPQIQNAQYNPFKSTSYSLGITMLHLMTLTSMEILYLKNQVNQSLVNEILRCTNYSNKLINKIHHLLFSSPNQRADFLFQVNRQANLQQKILQSPTKIITQNQSCFYRQSQSPLIRTMQPHLSHSPFTFRTIDQPKTPLQQVHPQQIIIEQSSARQKVQIPSPMRIIKQQEQQSQLIFKPNQSLQNKEIIQNLEDTTASTDLDYKIQKALKQTNETIKKNYMLQ